MGNTFVLFQFLHNSFIIMKAFIAAAVAAIGSAAPAADPQLLQSGLPAGPLTPAWGDLVATPRGARPLHLEGFSEDVNQDGFVDPIGQAAVAVAAPAVYAHHALPALTYALPTVKAVEVKAPEPVEVKAPVVPYAGLPYAHAYAHAPVAYAHSLVHTPVTHTYTVPTTHTETVHVGTHVATNVLPHVYGAGYYGGILGGLPVVAAAKPAEEAVVAEE